MAGSIGKLRHSTLVRVRPKLNPGPTELSKSASVSA